MGYFFNQLSGHTGLITHRIDVRCKLLSVGAGELDQAKVGNRGRRGRQERQVGRRNGGHVVEKRDGARRGVLAGPVLGVVEWDQAAVIALYRQASVLNA